MSAVTIQQFSTVLEVLTSLGDKKIKNRKTGKEETKLLMFIDDSIKSPNYRRVNCSN